MTINTSALSTPQNAHIRNIGISCYRRLPQHPITMVNIIFFLNVNVLFWIISLLQGSTWLIGAPCDRLSVYMLFVCLVCVFGIPRRAHQQCCSSAAKAYYLLASIVFILHVAPSML